MDCRCGCEPSHDYDGTTVRLFRWDYAIARQMFRRLCEVSGFHCLRQTKATEMLARGVPYPSRLGSPWSRQRRDHVPHLQPCDRVRVHRLLELTLTRHPWGGTTAGKGDVLTRVTLRDRGGDVRGGWSSAGPSCASGRPLRVHAMCRSSSLGSSDFQNWSRCERLFFGGGGTSWST
jgi:hypothetical protein